MTRRQQLTLEKRKERFLKVLALNVGNISRAATAAGVCRQSCYVWRENDAEFAAKWDATVERAIDEAEHELYRRAVKGCEKPVYQGGKLVGKVREFSDTCLIFLLKGRRPSAWNPVQKIAPTDPTGTREFVFRDADHDGL